MHHELERVPCQFESRQLGGIRERLDGGRPRNFSLTLDRHWFHCESSHPSQSKSSSNDKQKSECFACVCNGINESGEREIANLMLRIRAQRVVQTTQNNKSELSAAEIAVKQEDASNSTPYELLKGNEMFRNM